MVLHTQNHSTYSGSVQFEAGDKRHSSELVEQMYSNEEKCLPEP